MVDKLLALFLGEKALPRLSKVLETLDPEVLELLALPQAERAEAAEMILQPLDINSTSKVVYMCILKVPRRSWIWEKLRHAFREGAVDKSKSHTLMYNGSGAGEDGSKQRAAKQNESEKHRKDHPSLSCTAMDERGTIKDWRRVGVAKKEGESRALIRIVEAVAVATTYTYTSSIHITLSKEYGVVEESSKAFGCNRTSVMKAFISDGQSVSTSAIQRVMNQKPLEKYGGP